MLAIIAVVQQGLAGLDCDVSWLLTVSERVLDGATLYRDVVEVNPPASMLLYLPGVALARLLHLRPELAVVALTFAVIAGAVRSIDRLLAPPPAARPWLVAAAIWALAVLPANCFAQREHWALLAVLPLLCVLIARSEARAVALVPALLAGLGGGVAIAIKPHFVLALLPVLGWSMWRRGGGRARAIGPEWLAAGLIVVAYALTVALAFPRYLSDMLPLLSAVYLPARESWTNLVWGPIVLMPALMAVLAVHVEGAHLLRTPAGAMLLAAAGFAAAALVQGKGYLNHVYPGAALAYLAAAMVLIGRPAPARLPAGAWFALAAIGWNVYAAIPSPVRLAEAAARVAPPHPSLIVAGDDFMLGHPLTRWLDGHWVGRRGSLWASGSARGLLARPEIARDPVRAARLRAIMADDVGMFVADVARGRPDLVLVQRSARGWLGAYPAVGRALAPYRRAARVDDVELWIRSRAPSRPA